MSKKFIIILTIILFFSAIFQALVVTDYYLDGFNLGFFKYNENTDLYFRSFSQTVRERFHKPFDIFVRSGVKTWILKQDDDSFTNLWADGRKTLAEILESDFVKENVYWGKLCENDGITYSLGSHLPVEYLSVMTETENIIKDFKTIDKIMIIPKKENLEVFLQTDNGVYKAISDETRGLLEQENFVNLVELLSKEPYYSKNSLTDISQFMDERVIKGYMEPDIPVNFDVTAKIIPWIKAGVPETIRKYIGAVKTHEGQDRAAMENFSVPIKETILRNSVNVYETLFDSAGNLFFSNQFNMYEINTEGWIKYSYTPGTEGDEKGTMGAAFQNAVETVDRIMELCNSTESKIYVSAIEEADDYYIFNFDYRFKSGAIAINDRRHAMTVKATATRTIGAEMLPLEINELSGDEYIESKFITQFLLVMNNNDIIDLNRIEAYNMYVGYENFKGTGVKYLKPMWIIEKKNGEKQILELPIPGAGE